MANCWVSKTCHAPETITFRLVRNLDDDNSGHHSSNYATNARGNTQEQLVNASLGTLHHQGWSLYCKKCLSWKQVFKIVYDMQI